jgi:hypothetical protein
MSRRITAIICSLAMLVGLIGCDQKPSPAAKPAPKTPAKLPPGLAQAAGQPAAQQPQQQPAQPAAQPTGQGGAKWFCDQPVIEYGEVWVNAVLERQFTFRNAGTEVLKLGKPQPLCSCSSVPNYTQEVPPGGTGSITYHLKTERKPYGPSEEHINFTTNDPASPKIYVAMKGFIKTVLDPEVIYDAQTDRDKAAGKAVGLNKKAGGAFGKVKSEDPQHRVIKLKNTSGRPLTLTMQPIPPNSRFQLRLNETMPGQEYEFDVTADSPLPVGEWSVPVTFQTNIPEQQAYVLWVSAHVPPRVEVIPPTKMVIDQNSFPQKERRITINNNGTTPVNIVSVSTSEPAFGISLLPRDPAKPKEQVLIIALPGGESYRPPPYGEVIEIKTDDPEVPVVRIQVLPSLTAQPTPRPPDKPLQMHPVALPGVG